MISLVEPYIHDTLGSEQPLMPGFAVAKVALNIGLHSYDKEKSDIY